MKRKIFAKIAAAIFTLTFVSVNAITAFAAEIDEISLDCSEAKEAGNWETSISFDYNEFDTTRLTERSQIIVDYEIIEKSSRNKPTGYPCELIVQSWEGSDAPGNNDGNVWARITPYRSDDNKAVFRYKNIIEHTDNGDGTFSGYGTDDLSKVSAINFGATSDAKLKVTGIKITNVLPESESNHRTEPAVKNIKEKQTGPSYIRIIIGIGAGILIALAILIFIMNGKASQTFDTSTGQFISKKEARIKAKKAADAK